MYAIRSYYAPRFVEGVLDAKLAKSLPASIKKVGVFVNASLEEIKKATEKYSLDVIQLHGHEEPELCQKVKETGLEVIKAFQVKEAFDFFSINAYKPVCDYFLFDTATKGYGGSGYKFNWDILKDYDNEKPLFLSGGIGPDDAAEVEKLGWLNIKAIDINSKFEIEPANKDIEKLKSFILEVRNR